MSGARKLTIFANCSIPASPILIAKVQYIPETFLVSYQQKILIKSNWLSHTEGLNTLGHIFVLIIQPEDHWSCIAYLIAEDVLKSAVIEEKKFKIIECK